jgi:uncharacterized protein YecT (DUF1311 family)
MTQMTNFCSSVLMASNKGTRRIIHLCKAREKTSGNQAELNTRFEALDRQLNAKYANVIAKTEKNRISNVREAQRNWIKHRDEGAKSYVSMFPQKELEQRRLQFLGDVTAARIEVPIEQWEERLKVHHSTVGAWRSQEAESVCSWIFLTFV